MSIDRLVIVGFGSIGQRHARLAREALPSATIAVLRRTATDAPAGSPANRFLSTLDEAVAFRPQVAVIAGPATHHVEPAIALAKADAHLLVEKPIAHASDRVPELIDICRSRKRALMVGYNLRFHPSLRRFHALIREGRAGRVLSVRAEVGQYLPTWRLDVDYRESVSARKNLGGGVLLELSHEMDYLRWLFGEVESVTAVATKQSDLEIDVEDSAQLIMKFASTDTRGVVASVALDFIRHDHTRRCVVIGDRGTLRWDGIAGRVEWFAADSSHWKTEFDQAPVRDESYRAEWKEFLRCIEADEQPEPSGPDALATLRVVEAARESGRTNRMVNIPSPTAADRT